MNIKKTLSWVHLAGTGWFMLCTGYIFIVAMWQAGFNWLVIFSLSGPLALFVALLVCLYVFVIFRGAEKGADMEQEHPLTSTTYYMAFYVSTPFLGAIAGMPMGITGEARIASFFEAIAMGTIGATFLTWILVDCIAGSVEILSPQPRKHRSRRLEAAKVQKQQEQENRDRLLAEILKQEYNNKRLWERELAPQAGRLASLLAGDPEKKGADRTEAELEGIDIGVEAWRLGGLNCMKQLRNMAMNNFRHRYSQRQFIDYVSAWWDGIGNWRMPAVG